MDLSKEDLLQVESALTHEAWAGVPVRDLLFRVRRELLMNHGVQRGERPPQEDRTQDFQVTEPKPTSDGWPDLKPS